MSRREDAPANGHHPSFPLKYVAGALVLVALALAITAVVWPQSASIIGALVLLAIGAYVVDWLDQWVDRWLERRKARRSEV